MFTRSLVQLLVLFALPLVLASSAGAQTAIQITSVDVIQRLPGSLSEDYRRGWSLNASVIGVNPVGSDGGLLYLSVYVSENHPATIGPSGPCASTQYDLVLSSPAWRDTPDAGPPAGTGGPTAFRLDPNPEDNDSEPRPFRFDFTFGTLCDDVRIEETETFSVRAWFEPRDSSGTRSHGGAGYARDLLIEDDEIEPLAPTRVVARGTAAPPSASRGCRR